MQKIIDHQKNVASLVNDVEQQTKNAQFATIVSNIEHLQSPDCNLLPSKKTEMIESILWLITDKEWAVTMWDEKQDRSNTILDVVENNAWFYKLYPVVSKLLHMHWIKSVQVWCWIINNHMTPQQVVDIFNDCQLESIKQGLFDELLRTDPELVEGLIDSGVIIKIDLVDKLRSKINNLKDDQTELRAQYWAILKKLELRFSQQQNL